ncbi:MAG: hypothetical protein ABWX92_17015 [Mycetocola sp.]
MSSTASETLTRETATVFPAPAEPTHFARMGAVYAWVIVTLGIFMLAGTLSGMERGAEAADTGVPRTETVTTVVVDTTR